MSFPTINFKALNSTVVDNSLFDLLEQKFQSLAKYIGDETDVKCDVEFEKMSPSRHGNIFRVEANLWLHGKMYRADAAMENFEMAIDKVRAELDKELRRANDRRDSLIKRGGRKIKEMLNFGSD